MKNETTESLKARIEELEDQITELIREESAASSQAHRMGIELNMAKVRLAQLEAFNIQLQATHQGGQTGVECAELQAQNNTLRHELGLAHQRNMELSQEFEDFRNKALYKSQ